MKHNWQTSSLNPPNWWQLHLGNGLITISIRYEDGQVFELNPRNTGYHTQIGSGLATRENVLPTLESAKIWGLQAVSEALEEMAKETHYEIPWLLYMCLIAAVVLQISWMLLLG